MEIALVHHGCEHKFFCFVGLKLLEQCDISGKAPHLLAECIFSPPNSCFHRMLNRVGELNCISLFLFFPSLRGKYLASVECLLIPNRNLTFSFRFFNLSNFLPAGGGGGVHQQRVTIIPPSNHKGMPEHSSAARNVPSPSLFQGDEMLIWAWYQVFLIRFQVALPLAPCPAGGTC